MEFRDYLLGFADQVIAQIGGPTRWEAVDLEWMEAGPTPPEGLEGLDFEVESIYDPENHCLARLREARSSVTLEARDPSSGASWRVNVPVSEPPGIAMAIMAEQMQDHVLESAEAYGMPLPTCPFHGVHPLSPAVVGVLAVWRCPESKAVAEPVGGPGFVGGRRA